MKVEISVNTTKRVDVVKEKVIHYFESAGYKTGHEAGLLVFTRGSLLGSLTSFSPKGWKTSVRARVSPITNSNTEATFSYDINTTGQRITQSEMDFWNTEITGIERIITTGEFVSDESMVAEKAAIRSNWKLVGECFLYVPTVFVLLASSMAVAVLVARLMGPWLIGLVSIVGKEGVGLLSAALLLGTLGIWTLLPLASWVGRFGEYYLQNIPKPVAAMMDYALYTTIAGTLTGCMLVFASVMRIMDSTHAVWYWSVTIASMFAMVVISDRKRKKKQGVNQHETRDRA